MRAPFSRLVLVTAILAMLGGCASLTPKSVPDSPTTASQKVCEEQVRAAGITPCDGSLEGSASATSEASTSTNTVARATQFIRHLLVEPAPNPMYGVLVARCLRANNTLLLQQP
jgi:hypothetical protein